MRSFILTVSVIAVASIWGPMIVALVAGLTAGSLILGSSDDEKGYRTMPLAIAGSSLFPLTAVRWAESSSLIAMSAVVLVGAAKLVFKGLKEGAVVSYSHLLIRVLTTGFLLSFLPMIRSIGEGQDLIWAFLLSLSAMYFAKRLTAARFAEPSQRWVPLVAGVAASATVSAVSLVFLPDTFSLAAMLILGVTVGLAGLLGEVSERMLSTGAPGRERFWRGLGPLLVAAPAFFYAFRLYLT